MSLMGRALAESLNHVVLHGGRSAKVDESKVVDGL
jgi:hypothetical protein